MSTRSAPATYFDQAYRDYRAQNPPRKLDHYLDQIDAQGAVGPVNLLDIGCGLGAFLERAAGRHPDWLLAGSDIDLDAVEGSKQLIPGATILRASATDAPFEDASLDVITAWDVIEHVADLESVASSVKRMLKPNGLFVFVVPVYDGISGPLIRRLDKDPTHIHKRSRDDWLEWTSEHFNIMEWHGLVRYLVGGSYMHLPTKLLRSHSPAVLVTSRCR